MIQCSRRVTQFKKLIGLGYEWTLQKNWIADITNVASCAESPSMLMLDMISAKRKKLFILANTIILKNRLMRVGHNVN